MTEKIEITHNPGVQGQELSKKFSVFPSNVSPLLCAQ